MKLNYELTIDDLLAFNDYIQKTRGNKKGTFLNWGLFGIFLIYVLYSEFKRGSFSWGTIVIVAFVAAMFYLFSRRSRNAGISITKRAVKENPKLIGYRTVEFSEDSLIYTTPSSTSTYNSKSFMGIEETTKHLYLILGKTSALILPKRVFGNISEIEKLKDWVNAPK